MNAYCVDTEFRLAASINLCRLIMEKPLAKKKKTIAFQLAKYEADSLLQNLISFSTDEMMFTLAK